MVEQPTSGSQRGVELAVVRVELRLADVLGHADRGDGVERLAPELAVVLQPDLDAVGDPGVLDPAPGELGLGLADGDADDLGAVVGGGVDRHRSPPAADVEQSPARRARPDRACGR